MVTVRKPKPGERLSARRVKALKDKEELLRKHYGDDIYRDALRGRLPPPALKELLERGEEKED